MLPRLSEGEAESLAQAYDHETEIRNLYAAQLAEKLQREAEQVAETERQRFAHEQALQEEIDRQAQAAQEGQARLAAQQEAAAAPPVQQNTGADDQSEIFGVGIIVVVLLAI